MDRIEVALRQAQDWWGTRGITAPVLDPTDLAGFVFGGIARDQDDDLPPSRSGFILLLREMPMDLDRQVRLILRQEPVPGIHATLAQVPDLLEERAILLHGVTTRLSIGGPNPAGHRIFHGDRTIPGLPMSRLLWVREGIAYMVDGWGLSEERFLRVAGSLRPLPDAPAAR